MVRDSRLNSHFNPTTNPNPNPGLESDRICYQVAWVPGSFELPVVAKCMAKSGKFDAVVAIGAVVCFCTGGPSR